MWKRLFRSQLRRNMISGVIYLGGNLLVLLVSYPVYLALLGYDELGLWLVLATVLTFAQLGNLGISQALMKLVAEHVEGDDRSALRELLGTATTILGLMALVVSAVVSALRSPIADAFGLSAADGATARELLPWVAILSGYVLLVQVQAGVLSGAGRMDLSNYMTLGSRVLAFAGSVAGVLLGFGLWGLLVGNAIGWIAAHVAYAVAVRRLLQIGPLCLTSFRRARMKTLLGFGSPVVLGSLVGLFLNPFNKLMISRYIGLSAVSVFELANQGAMQVRGVAGAGFQALVPEASRLAAGGEAGRGRLLALSNRARRLLLLGGGLAYAVLFVLGPWLMQLWLGAQYVDSIAVVFRILLVGSFASLLAVPAYYLLLGSGWLGSCLGAFLVQSGANVLLVTGLYLFTGSLSITSVALAVAASFSLSAVYQLWRQHLLLRRRPVPSARQPSPSS
jgi:O-antigen/teichoic acid export membrane protein